MHHFRQCSVQALQIISFLMTQNNTRLMRFALYGTLSSIAVHCLSQAKKITRVTQVVPYTGKKA